MSFRVALDEIQPDDIATLNDYDDTTDVDLGRGRTHRLSLKNTHAAASLKYKIVGKRVNGGTLSEDVVAEATLAALTQINLADIAGPWGELILRCKSAVVDTPATLVVEGIHEAAQLL